jgi:hypothetical protein
MSDLFIRLFKLSQHNEENFLTECLAATLQADPQLRTNFLTRVFGASVDNVSLEGADIHIETQKHMSPECRPDMVFIINGVMSLAVENKLWSEEGDHQLLRYLGLEFRRVAFITGKYAAIENDVLANDRYARPDGRSHYMWSDVWDVVDATSRNATPTILNSYLLSLLTDLGFEPPRPGIGDLNARDEPTKHANRENFAKYWALTRQRLTEHGWKSIGAGSIAELYVRDGQSKRLKMAWLDPIWLRGSLRVRLTCFGGVDALSITEKLRARDDIELVPVSGKRAPEFALDVVIPFRRLFGDDSEPVEITERLADFIVGLFDQVETTI